MNAKMFCATVAAYLTGWVIAQGTFRRLWDYAYSEKNERQRHQYQSELAAEILDQLDRRRESRDRRLEMRRREEVGDVPIDFPDEG